MTKQSIPYSLQRNEAVRTGLERILNDIGQTARDLSEKTESKLEKSIHDIRTLIKRLRAYLWFLCPVIGKTLRSQGDATLRRAARRLSKTRDRHAVTSALTKAAIPATDKEHLQALAQVSRTFARQILAAPKTDNGMRTLEEVTDKVIQTLSKVTGTLKRNTGEVPSPGLRLKKAFRRARKAMKATTRKKDPRLVHEWRKKSKRLFYILQLTARLPHAGMADCLKLVDKLQEHLGDFQDNIVAERHLRAHSPEVDSAHLKRAIHLLRENRKILLKHAHHCWDAILEEV